MSTSRPSPAVPPASPILSIERGDAAGVAQLPAHAHPEPVLLWTSTATVLGTIASRDWLVPPGYGLWIPGGVEHGGTMLREGEISVIHFAAGRCPVTWTEPTGVAVGPLLRELIRHLRRAGPEDPGRLPGEALLFELLSPLPAHDIQISLPADPRVRPIAERLLAHPADQRELTAWAAHLHTGERTLSRLFRAETGLSFTAWRTHVRVRAAIQLLCSGTTVNATAHAVGYRRPSAFISA
ncbi:MAG: helix-turn-helix domain-containing protein, partial [Trebonia sp.]